jgi:hypothetical protein
LPPHTRAELSEPWFQHTHAGIYLLTNRLVTFRRLPQAAQDQRQIQLYILKDTTKIEAAALSLEI